jgi:hypothetical protein
MKTLVIALATALALSTSAFAQQQQREWNEYAQKHGRNMGGYIYTPYSAKFNRGGIHCDDTGQNTRPSCDAPGDQYGGGGG